ncbi:hypothetical protein CEP53_010463 [Fusarium sp. AF-6]|nr:hypothetical protein CEP53_010463 [Fusarium sp. AF-6]
MAAPTAGGGRRDGVDGCVGGTTAPARPIQRLRRIQDGESEFESGSKRDPTRSIFDGIIAMSYQSLTTQVEMVALYGYPGGRICLTSTMTESRKPPTFSYY